MNIVEKDTGTPFVVGIEGRLDTNTSPELDTYASELYENGTHDIVVDMTDCEFVSSAGLRVIVAMQKRATVDGSLVFRNVHPEVMEVLKMTGFDNILTIE